jgi:hypothetical protein
MLHRAPHEIAEIATLAEALPILPAVSEFEARPFLLLDAQNETESGQVIRGIVRTTPRYVGKRTVTWDKIGSHCIPLFGDEKKGRKS